MFAKLKPVLLRAYRLGLLVLIFWVVQEHYFKIRVGGDAPVTLEEVRAIFPTARSVDLDHGPRKGWFIRDETGKNLGYAACTQPHCRDIIGYCGITDVLLVFGAEDKIKTIKIRRSEDTIRHVEDVATDRQFLRAWVEMYWDDIAALDLASSGIDGVSGATQTSLAVIQSIIRRCTLGNAKEKPLPARKIIVRSRDIGILVVTLGACLMAFTRLHERKWLRYSFQAFVVLYLGFLNGDLLAQSLVAGWGKAGINWHLAPGMVLLAAVAFILPWATRKPVYCHHICPYGFLQQWVGRLGLKKYRFHLPASVDRPLRTLPFILLIMVVFTVMWQLPVDLANLEPFDAFIIRTGAWVSMVIAIAGLLAALFVPQAYCKYGCPTGKLLEYVRSHGSQDHFGKRDWAAAGLLGLTWGLYQYYPQFVLWLNQTNNQAG